MLRSVWYAVTLSCVLVLLWLARQPAVHTVCDVEQCVVCCDMSSVLVSLGLARQPAVHTVCDVEQCVVCCDTVVCVGVVWACTATRCTYCV